MDTSFEDCFHPDSLIPTTDAEAILDLAKQAACIHSISHEQIIKLDSPITEPCSYHTLISKLASAKKSDGKGELKPPIMPQKKLFPRETLKDMDKDHTRDSSEKNSRMMEGSEKMTSQTSTDNSKTTLKKISVKVGAEITNKHSVESGENAEKGANKETSTPSEPSEKESEERRGLFSKTSSEKIKNADSDTCQAIKEEKIEEPTVRKPSGENLESCQNTDKDDAAKIGEERIKSRKDVPTQLKNNMYKENKRKRPSSMSEKSQDTYPYEDVKKDMDHKRQRLTSKHNLRSCGQKEATTVDEGESSKPSHETAKDKASSNENHQQADQLWQYLKRKSREPVIGLSALLECHCDQHDPIYLCECCSLKIPEKDIISHVTGFDHQMIYLGLQNLPQNHQMKTIRHRAALFEKDKGYGEAQVVDLDEESCNNISKQNFESAIQTVKALQAQQDSGSEVPSTSALSAVQPVGTSVTLHAQREVHPVTYDFLVSQFGIRQVVDMEIDEAQPSSVTAAVSVMTETTSKTPVVRPESNEDVTVTHIRESESADNANTCQTVSRSSEDTSSLHVSSSGTNTTSLYPDSTRKAEITSNTTVGPLKFSRETAYKCVTATFSATATTSKCTATASKLTGTASTSSATISCTTSTTKSATVSKPLKSRTAAAQMQVAVTSYKAATASKTGSTVVHEATSRTAPASKIENASKNSETASKTTAASQTMVTSEATAKVIKASVKCENTEAFAKTVHMKNSVPSNADVAPNIPKSNAPTEPSHTSASKTKPSESSHIVGLSQLIKVSCEGRHQVYCQLCSVRMKCSTHPSTFSHKFNYVKMKFPGWTAKQSELDSKLHEIVARLAEAERDVGSRAIQRIKVKIGVYEELGALPVDKAIEMLKAMLTQRDLKVSSSSTTEAAEVLRQQVAFASPCEVSSPDDEMYMPQSEMAGLSTDNQSEQENKHELQTLLVQMQVKMETPQGCADPLATDSESTGRFAQTPDPCQESLEKGHQQERSDPDLQDTQKVLEGTLKTSPINFFNPDPLASAASVKTEQQNQSRPSLKAEHIPKPSCRPGPRHHNASQALPRISIGERTQGPSHLSTYLKVKGLETEPIIGLGSVWECRGISLNPFFLCESCRETLSTNEICKHVVSNQHLLKYMLRQYPQFLFWMENDLLQDMKLQLLKETASLLSVRELYNKIDAQCILLGKELYECVRTASFSEALEMVRNIEKEQKLSVFCPPICTPQQKDQQPEDWQSQEESLLKEMPSAQALETDQRSDNEARQKTEKCHLEETAMVGDLDGVKQRRVLSPLDATSVSSKADSFASPFPGADTRLSPQETCRSLSTQPELNPPVSQHQRPIAELQVKWAELHLESPSSSIVSPSQTLSVSPRDKCFPTRKRPAVTYVETLVRPCTNNPQLEDPLPAKRTHTCTSLQPISLPSPESASESTPNNPAATLTPLYPKNKDTRPGSDEQDASMDSMVPHLIALLKEKKSEMNVFHAETTTSCTNTSLKNGVQRKWDPKCVQTTSTSTMAKKRKRWDSKCQLIKATVKKIPPSATSLEGMFSTAASVVFGSDNQFVSPNTNSAFSANNSSHEDYIMRAPEAKADGTMLPSAGTADPSDPQHQSSANAESVFGNGSQFQPSTFYCVANNHNPWRVPQPRGNPETGITGVCQLPINAIISARTDPTNQQFMGNYNGQDHTEWNRGNQVSPSFSTVATASPSDTLAASGGYGQYSQMTYVMNGHSGYLSSVADAGYITPDNPHVYTGSLYQHEGYTTRRLYPSQIYPEPEANRFGHSLATPTPPGWVRLEMQQQQQQQHDSAWTGAALAAGSGYVTSEAAYFGAVQFPTPANNSQRLIDLNDYSTNRIVSTQNNDVIITQNTPQVYLNPPVIHCSAANSEIVSQGSANSFFVSGRGVFTVTPSMVDATPPFSHETTHSTM